MYIIASCFLVIIRSIIVDTDYESILIEYTLVMTFEDICKRYMYINESET